MATALLIGPGGKLGEIIGAVWLVVVVLLALFPIGRKPELGSGLKPLDPALAQRRTREANKILIGTAVTVAALVFWVIFECLRYAHSG